MFLGILSASIAELTLGQERKHARPELLIEASELAKPDVHRSFVILDAEAKTNTRLAHSQRNFRRRRRVEQNVLRQTRSGGLGEKNRRPWDR